LSHGTAVALADLIGLCRGTLVGKDIEETVAVRSREMYPSHSPGGIGFPGVQQLQARERHGVPDCSVRDQPRRPGERN
jgi:hypothetical protein